MDELHGNWYMGISKEEDRKKLDERLDILARHLGIHIMSEQGLALKTMLKIKSREPLHPEHWFVAVFNRLSKEKDRNEWSTKPPASFERKAKFILPYIYIVEEIWDPDLKVFHEKVDQLFLDARIPGRPKALTAEQELDRDVAFWFGHNINSIRTLYTGRSVEDEIAYSVKYAPPELLEEIKMRGFCEFVADLMEHLHVSTSRD